MLILSEVWMLLFKILFLFAALKLHDVKTAPFQPTLLYSIPVLLINLFGGVPLLPLFFISIIMLCVSYVYFSLLTKFNFGLGYFVIMCLGGVILVLLS